MFFYDWTYFLIIPGLILGIWAQMKVKSTYAEYSRIPTRQGYRRRWWMTSSAATATIGCPLAG